MKSARIFLEDRDPKDLLYRFLRDVMSEDLMPLWTAQKAEDEPRWPNIDIAVKSTTTMKNGETKFLPVMRGGVVIARTSEDPEQDASPEDSDGYLEGSDSPDDPDALEVELVMGEIASCMDKSWPENCPIFMIKSIGSRVTVYEAVFSENLLDKVESGEPATEQTVVYKYHHPSYPGGLDMMVPEHREVLVQTICYVQSRIAEFPWEGDE